MQHPLNPSRPDLSDKKVLNSGGVGIGMVSYGGTWAGPGEPRGGAQGRRRWLRLTGQDGC